VKFKVGDKLIQLGGVNLKNFPEKVEGIKVGKRFAKLHLLQACGHTANEGQVIGEYVVHYEDKKTEKIEIAFGKDVRDWWFYKDTAGVSRGKVAWEGKNEASEKANAGIRLYVTTWENPRPGKRVVSIDFVSKMTTAEPFLVAMTAEEK
jgi:hypothetical protein